MSDLLYDDESHHCNGNTHSGHVLNTSTCPLKISPIEFYRPNALLPSVKLAAAMESQRILVIGGTGAQGTAVVKSLLKAEQPYRIRILTRNPADASTLAKFPTESGVELVKGKIWTFTGHEIDPLTYTPH